MEVSENESGVRELLRDRIGYELKRAQHALRLRMDEVLRETGVTAPQYAALSVLSEEPGVSNAQLARRSFVTPQTMNNILVRLEAAGFVERKAHPEHGRVLQAYLTENGEKLRGECARRVGAVEERMASGLTVAEQRALLDALRSLYRALSDA